MDDSRSNDIKLSYDSIERSFFILFVPRPYWEQDIDKKKAADSYFVGCLVNTLLFR
jgi:hypothetical protein